MKILVFIIILITSTSLNSFQIPKEKKVIFDLIRKNKIIGTIETLFEENDDLLIVSTNVEIEVKALFLTVYKFTQSSKETWHNGEFIEFEGHTDFEDEREYFIKGQDTSKNFTATGMDGEIIYDKKILPLNYWNKDILNEKTVFDTQKGISRDIKVQKLEDELVFINNHEINSEKFLLDASSNPKDKGPFPQYTLWYAKKNNELIKFRFINWKDKKEVIAQRNSWED
tara:strand:+ start:331 stop:1011 length:681 start_codon:yes stop_codon:yes gene_type:complete